MLEHMDGQMSDVVLATTYIDENLKIKTLNNIENEFEYRKSIFSENKEYIILSAKIKLEKGIKDEIKNKMEENLNSRKEKQPLDFLFLNLDFLNSRKEKQPLDFPSAGSVFKRNGKYIPAMLIDQCGLKGYNIKDAYVSEKHAGFIVNKGFATAKDILELIKIIKEEVFKKYNVQLELELEVMGED